MDQNGRVGHRCKKPAGQCCLKGWVWRRADRIRCFRCLMPNRGSSISAHSSIGPRTDFREFLALICPNRNRPDRSRTYDDDKFAFTIVIGVDRVQTQAGCPGSQVRCQTKLRTAGGEVDADLIYIGTLTDNGCFRYVIPVKIVFKPRPIREIVGVVGPVRCGHPGGSG